jgi:type I site-specific restriction endonuclease
MADPPLQHLVGRLLQTDVRNAEEARALARRLKTLIFCVNDLHADLVVEKLKDALEGRYGPISDNLIAKITGQADKPPELIRRYKNESRPTIAVTVDLLTTGIDVPEIVNLVSGWSPRRASGACASRSSPRPTTTAFLRSRERS